MSGGERFGDERLKSPQSGDCAELRLFAALIVAVVPRLPDKESR
jgi:hypothetical protein